MKLIFQTDRQAMQHTNRLLVLLEILVRLLGLSDSLIEEDLVQTIDQLMGDRSTVAESSCDLHRFPLSGGGLLDHAHRIRLCDLNLFLVQVLSDKVARNVALLFRRWDVRDPPFFRDESQDAVGFRFRGLLPVFGHGFLRLLCLLLLLLVVCLELSPVGGLEVDFRRGLGAFIHEGGGQSVCMSEKSQDLRYFLSTRCPRVVYAAEAYRCVVDLPFGEKRGFEATTYKQTLVLGGGADVDGNR
jgi:hypothetical protein